jgi:hypothetical protein
MAGEGRLALFRHDAACRLRAMTDLGATPFRATI